MEEVDVINHTSADVEKISLVLLLEVFFLEKDNHSQHNSKD